MIVHLAFADEEMKGVTFGHPNWGAEWRQRDFAFVTSDAFRKLLKENNVKLITWREVGKLVGKTEQCARLMKRQLTTGIVRKSC